MQATICINLNHATWHDLNQISTTFFSIKRYNVGMLSTNVGLSDLCCRLSLYPMMNTCILPFLHMLLVCPCLCLSCLNGWITMEPLILSLWILYLITGRIMMGSGYRKTNWNSTLSEPHSFPLATVRLYNSHIVTPMLNGVCLARCTKPQPSLIDYCRKMRQRREAEESKGYTREMSRLLCWCNVLRSVNANRGQRGRWKWQKYSKEQQRKYKL